MKRTRIADSLCTVLLAIALFASMVSCSGRPGQSAQESSEPGPGAADCARIAELINQVECFADAATQAGDSRICLAAAHDGVRSQCIAILAERLQNAALCNDIPASSKEARALRDLCLSDVAEALDESALCSLIRTVGLQDSCYLKVAQKTDNLLLCGQIMDEGLRSYCRGQRHYSSSGLADMEQ